MTDKELLELAAKAAGIKLDRSWFGGFDLLGNAVLDWHNNHVWNPLTNDGDALRLAVKLRMDVDVCDNAPGYSTAWAMAEHDNGSGCVEQLGDDPYAATRRVIVRAAAEIGKQKDAD